MYIVAVPLATLAADLRVLYRDSSELRSLDTFHVKQEYIKRLLMKFGFLVQQSLFKI
jgi:hypothetical protein